MIIFVWAFPFAIGSIPFMMFFNPDRTQWLTDNGFVGIDWSLQLHTTIRFILVGLCAAYLFTMSFRLIYKSSIENKEDSSIINKIIESRASNTGLMNSIKKIELAENKFNAISRDIV